MIIQEARNFFQTFRVDQLQANEEGRREALEAKHWRITLGLTEYFKAKRWRIATEDKVRDFVESRSDLKVITPGGSADEIKNFKHVLEYYQRELRLPLAPPQA